MEISKGDQKVVGSNMNGKFIQFIARGCAWPWSEPKRASVLIYTLQFIKFLLTVQLDGSGRLMLPGRALDSRKGT